MIHPAKGSYPKRVAWISLAAFALVMSLGKSYENTLRGIDSNIHAYEAMQVTAGGFLPKLPMPLWNSGRPGSLQETLQGTGQFNDHPFTMFWLNGKVMRFFGPSAWSARLLTGLFSAGCVLLTGWLGAILYTPLFGFVAALLLQVSRDYVLTGGTVSLDPPMLFFILLSFICWRHGLWWGLGLSAGVGLWIKTPVVLLVFPTALIVSAMNRSLKKDSLRLAGAFFLALLVGSGVWVATGLLGGWDLVHDYWLRQVWGTAVGGRTGDQSFDLFFFWRVIRTGLMPWLPLLFVGLGVIGYQKKWRHPSVAIPGVAAGIVIVLITLMRFKYGYYYNPAFPFLAFLGAYAVIDWLKHFENRVYLVFAGALPLLLAVLVCFPIVLGPEAFPALRKFAAIIQSYGSCADDIVLVRGEEPFASSLDYTVFLNFYTGRHVSSVDCKETPALNDRENVNWLIVSGQNYFRCLSAEERARFPYQFRFGTQVLLSRLIPSDSAPGFVDLSWLERDMFAPVDCVPRRFPRDIYHGI